MNVLFKLLQSAKRLDPGGFTLYKIFTEIEMDLPTKSPWPLCIEIIQSQQMLIEKVSNNEAKYFTQEIMNNE